jgi:hypothetical protein
MSSERKQSTQKAGLQEGSTVSRLLANANNYGINMGNTQDCRRVLTRNDGERLSDDPSTDQVNDRYTESVFLWALQPTGNICVQDVYSHAHKLRKRTYPTEQIAMTLPGNRNLSAVRLTGMDSDRQEPGQNSRSSRSAGKPRTGRRAVGMSVVGPCTEGKSHAFTG